MNSETPRSSLLQTRVPPDLRAQLEAVAADAGLTPSSLLRLLIENAVAGEDPPAEPAGRRSRARREGKVTVRLATDVQTDLEIEAKGQGLTVSTWAAALLSARMRSAPQLAKSQRRQTLRGFRQLHGMAVNVNQIAQALNRGVLTEAGAELTAQEVRRLNDEVARLRQELRLFASGQYKFQVPGAGAVE